MILQAYILGKTGSQLNSTGLSHLQCIPIRDLFNKLIRFLEKIVPFDAGFDIRLLSVYGQS